MTIDQVQLSPRRWVEFWDAFKAEPQQIAGIEELRLAILQADPTLLTEGASWVANFHKEQPRPLAPDYSNTWEGVEAAAKACGARWPQLVAAQWALESAHGTAISGKHNYFGIKGSGSSHVTQEEVNGQMVTITAGFIDFPCLKDCVDYLVSRWYLDFKGYQGVNHAASADAAAYSLKAQGYATDSQYPQKLINLMRQHA